MKKINFVNQLFRMQCLSMSKLLIVKNEFRSAFRFSAVFTLVFSVMLCLFSSSLASANPKALLDRIDTTLAQVEVTYKNRWVAPTEPAPELGSLVENAKAYLMGNREFKARAKSDLAFKALWIQTINHLQHASFTFERGAPNYTHKDLFKGQYPVLASLKALEKTADFFRFQKAPAEGQIFERISPDPNMEKALLAEQTRNAKALIQNSLEGYIELRNRIQTQGPNASFTDQFSSLVEYLVLKLKSDPSILQKSGHHPLIRNFRDQALAQLKEVAKLHHPYMQTLEAIERALEFLDVYQRSIDPKRSPVLYHSGRYQYYLHFLKANIRDHILIPTLASLGATDLLKIRGVPIGFAGVNTEISYVDGYYQTSFEFFIHDINHVRRMFLFFEKAAVKYGISIEEMAKKSDQFVKKILIPMISIGANDSDEVKNLKRLKKILFFEMFHEDALAAMPDILEEALLRAAGVLTPFEQIEKGKKVVYVMEPGASTMAYVFRKLAHDFYDMPGDRFSNVVDPKYRNYEFILEAAVEMLKELGMRADRAKLEDLLKQDTGLPKDFFKSLVRDHLKRPLETLPLISHERALALAQENFLVYHEESKSLDPRRKMEIINFFRDTKRIVVNLRVPVLDERGTIDIAVNVPQLQYDTNTGFGGIEQIHGQKRVIEISSGPYLNLESLKFDFLSRINPKYYHIVVRSDDPKANEIVAAARAYNIESILLVDSSSPELMTTVSANFIATFSGRRKLNEFVKKLAAARTENDLALRFDKPLKEPLQSLFSKLERNRVGANHGLIDKLVEKGIGHVELENFSTIFGARKPLAFIGASDKMWNKLTPKEKDLIRNTIEKAMDALDASKVVIVTSGVDTGIEKIVHEAARARGILTYGTLVESANINEIGPITHASIVARDWFGKPKPFIDFIRSQGGMVAYFSGGEYAEKELEAFADSQLKYYVIKGPRGATQQIAINNPQLAFRDAGDLLGLIYRHQPESIRADYQLPARDFLFDRYSKELSSMGTSIRSYPQLVEAARGKKVIMINGYVGLGYQNPERVKALFADLMKREGEGAIYVGVGTYDGIGLMYDWIPEIANKLGLKNIQRAAIVSRNVAVEQNLAPMELLHFSNTDVRNWRPTMNGHDLQVQFLKDTGGKLVAFSGGRVTGLVVEEALKEGLPVEILVGESVAPNQTRVQAAKARVASTVIDGTADLVGRKKQFKSLQVIQSFVKRTKIEKNLCANLFE